MKDRIWITIVCLVMLLVSFLLFNVVGKEIDDKSTSENKSAKIVVYGDNVDKSYTPYIENNDIYISFKTIEDFIDEDIFYDESTNTVIVTNENYVYKLSENSSSKNLEQIENNKTIKFIDDIPYINASILKEMYNVKCEYEEATDTVSIDNLTNSDLNLNYNEVRLYSDIKTNSKVLEVLNTDNTVVVYTESLNHNRWYKVKSDSGKIGYIEKSAVTIKDNSKDEENNDNIEETSDEKKIMFWQYGSSLETLGEKIDGVSVAMPTWFKLSADDGTVEMNFDRDYYNKAKENGYELYPILSNGFDSNEDFKEATSTVLKDEKKRENLIRNIVGIVNDYELDGINIDFESMKDEDKEYYTQFLKELHPLLKQNGKILSADVYFTTYIDRAGVGKVVDYFMLMGYDQRGKWSNEAGSISEISWVEKNVKSLIEDSKIDPQKIILGVPFYTRQWIEDDSGTLSSETLSIGQCQKVLSDFNLSTTFDPQSGQNYVSYEDKGNTYKLWIEDETSMKSRVDIVTKYNLGGITAWQKGLATDEIWNVIISALNE